MFCQKSIGRRTYQLIISKQSTCYSLRHHHPVSIFQKTSASALHEATAYSCQFWILLGSMRMWLGHKFVPNNVLHLFLSSRWHDRNSNVKSLNNIKPIQIIFIIIIYMFTIFCDRLKPSKNYLDIFISVEYCLPYWKQMNSIHN